MISGPPRPVIMMILLMVIGFAGGCARYGQEADLATTAVGLALGFTESNPVLAHPIGMGVGVMVKGGLPLWADTQRPEVCYGVNQTTNSLGWGAALANVLTLAGIIPGGLSALPIVAVTALWTMWRHHDRILMRCRR